MKFVPMFIVFFVVMFPAYGTEFKLSSFDRYGTPSMELSLYPEKANTLEEIFSVIKFSGKELNVRLIGISSDKTNNELLAYYQKIRTGNTSEAEKKLTNMFIPALKSTTLYKELEFKLKQEDYTLESISFEKLGPKSIPDVYFKFVREHY